MSPSPRQPDAAAEARHALAAGNPARAAALSHGALRARPDDPAIRAILGAALVRLGDPAGALPHLETASAAGASDPRTLNALANAYRMLARPDDALSAAERALASDPGSPTAICIKASVLRTTGRAAEGLALIEPLAQARPRSAAIACELADLFRSLHRPEDALDALDTHADRQDLPGSHHRAVHIRRAQLLDELGHIDDAFAAAARANADARTPKVAPAAPVIQRWTRAALDAIPQSTARGVTPVLVVGMPRSGTTLLERIISAHPRAAGAGECPALPAILDEHARQTTPPDQRWADEAGATYLQALAQAGPAATHVVDKMPANVFTLGLAERLTPDARIIHVRRDPRDVCLSCYLQELNDSMAFTRDLESCARQHIEIDRIMEHWRSTISLPWCEVRYEDLVTSPEGAVLRALDSAGLEFDPACLAFHESTRHVETASWAQVTRPLYTSSVGRWRRYERHLDRMLGVLARPGTP